MCCHRTFNKQWVDFHMLSVLFHLAVDVVFHMLSLASLKKQRISFSACYHCTLKRWMVFNMLSLFCKKQCMWFSTLLLLSFKDQRILFSMCCIGHLISSWWISICCDCCFNKQWMWFLHMLSLVSFNEQWLKFSMCSHSMFNN